MLKKLLLVMLSLVMLLLTAGCGDDFKGDWVRTIQDGKKKTSFHILHLGKADNGDYVIEQELKTFEKTNADGYINSDFSTDIKSFNNIKTRDGDFILNSNEVFTWQQSGRGLFATTHPIWNGTKLKLLQQYKYEELELSNVYQFKKEELTLKDGQLILDGQIYEKADKSKVDKMVSDYKDSLKKQIGTEVEAEAMMMGVLGEQLKGVVTKIVIIKNGLEKEVLGSDSVVKDNPAVPKVNEEKNNAAVIEQKTEQKAEQKTGDQNIGQKDATPAPANTQSSNANNATIPIEIASAYHSSADQEGNYVHSAKLAVDGDTNTCWSEGVKGYGLGENIEIHFTGTCKVSGMNIWIGHQKNESLFYQNGRPVALRVVGSDGSSEIYNLKDTFGEQRVEFKQPINVNKVKLVVEQIAKGNKYEDTCIAEVKFF